MKKSGFFNIASFAMGLGILALLVSLVTCGGGGGGGNSTGPSTGTVNTSISDPPTCKATFKNVWVTITRVRAHTSGNADSNASGWIDLATTPMQIDLLNLESTACVLTQLDSKTGIPSGQYQQIRLYLLSNSVNSGEAVPTPNNCKDKGNNCVVLEGGEAVTLDLSSEAQTGIKIPSGQIAGGKFVVPAGKVVDLNIDFDACASIVQQGNGKFRLKPVLHAAEVSLTNPIKISGNVIDSNSEEGISGAVVFLEKPDSSGIDRMIMQTLSKSDGTFIFCPLPSGTGTYDIVAAATNSSTTYKATVVLSVPAEANVADIPLVPEDGTPAQINGQITSVPNPVDISLSALQSVPVGGAETLFVTIPLFAGSTPNVTTETGVNYTLLVPASNPQWGTFSVTPPTSYTEPAAAPVYYWINAQAFVPSAGSTTDCTPSSLPLTFDLDTRKEVIEGGITQDFTFTGCDGQ